MTHFEIFRSESDTKTEDMGDINENEPYDDGSHHDDVMMDTKTEEDQDQDCDGVIDHDSEDDDGGEIVQQVDLVEQCVEEPAEDEQTYYRTQGGQMLPINVKVSPRV